MGLYVDYSAYSAFLRCALMWYEQYVRKIQRRRDGQRDDALARGSTVHAGLAAFYQEEDFQGAMLGKGQEIGLKPDTIDLMIRVMNAYVSSYTRIRYRSANVVERTLVAPINGAANPTSLTAKPDIIANLEEQEFGLGTGETAWLPAGWYLIEHKLKEMGVSRAHWMAQWQVRMQADFQILVAEATLAERVEGVIVNVLEYRKPYVPKCKCKGCRETVERSMYLIRPDGAFSCPLCGYAQELSVLRAGGGTEPPAFWRMVVKRDADRLAQSNLEIRSVARRMWNMINGLENSNYANLVRDVVMTMEVPAWDQCINPYMRYMCQFLPLHNSAGVAESAAYEPAEDYTESGHWGLVNEATDNR